MRAIIIGKNEDGQRFDRILIRLFPKAGKGFIFKMLRKKNIVLNGKKAEGNERLKEGDEIKMFFSEDTFLKLSNDYGEKAGNEDCSGLINKRVTNLTADESGQAENSVLEEETDSNRCVGELSGLAKELSGMIVYEDEDVIILNKPKGVLSQKAAENDISLNEMLIAYMLDRKEIDASQLATFKPAMCNRLDRNTSGLICGGKTLKGLRELSELFRSRTMEKYYLCIVKGVIENEERIEGYLVKNEKTNKVTVVDANNIEGSQRIVTQYKPLGAKDGCSLLEVKLITGKTHQIRSHLASIGHPLAGDMKYGDDRFNRLVRERYNIKSQLLTCYRLKFPNDCRELAGLNGKEIRLDKPDDFFI